MAESSAVAKIARRFYLFSFIDDFMLIYPVMTLLFADFGLTNFEISVVIATWSIVGLTMEVPSGVLADRYDRRHVLAFGGVMKTMGMCLWVIQPDFWTFLVGVALWGLQGAMVSGTFEALLYDDLKDAGAEDRYVNVEGKCSTAFFLGLIAAAGLAALTVRFGYDVVLWATVATSICSVAAALFLPTAPKSGQVEDAHYFGLLKAGISEAFNSRLVLLPLAVVAFSEVAVEGFADFIPLFAADIGVGETGASLVFLIVTVAAAFGGLLAARLASPSLYRPVVTMIVAGVVMVVAARLANIGAVGLLAVYYLITQVAQVTSSALLQKSISGPARATVTSVAAFGAHIFNVVFYLGFGLISDAYDRFAAFAVGGAAIAVLASLLLLAVQHFRTERVAS